MNMLAFNRKSKVYTFHVNQLLNSTRAYSAQFPIYMHGANAITMSGIGTPPPPLSQASEGVEESQFRRLEKELTTL
jgi:hypothetical protein